MEAVCVVCTWFTETEKVQETFLSCRDRPTAIDIPGPVEFDIGGVLGKFPRLKLRSTNST